MNPIPLSLPIFTDEWSEYQLLDAGHGEKLERFGSVILRRSEPQAWWGPSRPEEEWKRAHATVTETRHRATWSIRTPLPDPWTINFDHLTIRLRPTATSKHVGVFPEQSSQWRWIYTTIKTSRRPIRLLNLFGYTGLSTLAAASAGAHVTHVDASKPAITWATENQNLSHLNNVSIRWIPEDAMKFVEREKRRGQRYDAIVLDPPTFGHGPSGQLWKIEKDLARLLVACRDLLSPHPLFILCTTYSSEQSPLILRNIFSEQFTDLFGMLTAGTYALSPTSSDRLLPLSMFARFETCRP